MDQSDISPAFSSLIDDTSGACGAGDEKLSHGFLLFVAGVWTKISVENGFQGEIPSTENKIYQPESNHSATWCRLCNIEFHRTSLFRHHLATNHSEHSLAYFCYKCQERFQYFVKLRNHQCKNDFEGNVTNHGAVIHGTGFSQPGNITEISIDDECNTDKDIGEKTKRSTLKSDSQSLRNISGIRFSHRNPSTKSNVQINISAPHDLTDEVESEEGIKQEETLYTCKYCSENFSQSHKLRYHHLTVHKDKCYECQTCQTLFTSRNRFIFHNVKNHSSTTVFTCDECHRDFPNLRLLNIHVNRIHNKRFECKTCESRFGTKNELLRHTNVMHLGFRPYKCDICTKGFSTQTRLEVHVNQHKNIRPFQCTECCAGFYGKEGLNTHILRKHAEKKFQCRLCSKIFACVNALKKHEQNHDGTERIACPYCGIVMAATSVSNHIARMHTKDKPYPCPKCPKTFSLERILKNHMMVHVPREDYQHICSTCGERFRTNHLLVRHELCHSSIMRHFCPICGKGFKRSEFDLRKHISAVHQNLRPHQCDTCKKSFADKSNLRQHMKTHKSSLKDNPHICLVCKKTFAFPSRLKDHLRRNPSHCSSLIA